MLVVVVVAASPCWSVRAWSAARDRADDSAAPAPRATLGAARRRPSRRLRRRPRRRPAASRPRQRPQQRPRPAAADHARAPSRSRQRSAARPSRPATATPTDVGMTIDVDDVRGRRAPTPITLAADRPSTGRPARWRSRPDTLVAADHVRRRRGLDRATTARTSCSRRGRRPRPTRPATYEFRLERPPLDASAAQPVDAFADAGRLLGRGRPDRRRAAQGVLRHQAPSTLIADVVADVVGEATPARRARRTRPTV